MIAFSSFHSKACITEPIFVVNRYLRLTNVQAAFMMPNHNDILYYMIKMFTKPLMVKINHIGPQIGDSKNM